MSFALTWVEPDILAVGQVPMSDRDLTTLYKEGIRAVVNLRVPPYPQDWTNPGLKITHIPVEDMSIPTENQVTEFLITVQYHFERGEPVYLHCTAGCGRSGVMVALWLASLQKFDTATEIIEYIRSIRPCFIETEEQEKFVKEEAKEFLE